MEPRSFSAVTAVTEREPGRFSAEVDPEWSIGGKPNGGYLLSMLGRAATSISAHPHATAASAHYLHSPKPGPVLIETELLRAGRSASQIRARLEQDGLPCVEALITASQFGPDTTPYWDRGLPELSQSRYEDCPRLIPRLPNGIRVAIMEQIEVRLDPDSTGFTDGRPSGRGELRGWLALPGGEAFDPASLLYAVDAFPPATFDIAFSGWVPTLELTAYVRAVPAPGPVRVLHRAQLINAGRVDESCFVWDKTGRLVAQGTQLAGHPPRLIAEQENDMTQLIDRREGPYGEVALRRRDDCFEIIANGCFLMDSSDGRSERLLVSAALDLLKQPAGASLLIGGLGVGFSLAEACADPRPGRIHVVERERAIIDWHTQGEAPLRNVAGTGHDDPRTVIIHDDLIHHLRTVREPYDVLCLDIDNGPHWTVTDDNHSIYESAGLDVLAGALTDQAVLSVWSSARSPEFTQRLASRFEAVTTLEVPVLKGSSVEPDVVILATRLR